MPKTQGLGIKQVCHITPGTTWPSPPYPGQPETGTSELLCVWLPIGALCAGLRWWQNRPP